MLANKTFHFFYNKLLSEKTKKESERVILIIAIISFLIHLVIIYLVDYNVIQLNAQSELLKNPIAAIYTPFSFILVYEVYLVVFYLPKSISTYISKQYEIISLIIIRRLFKDLSNLTLTSDWFTIKYDLQFTYDLVASILLFALIFQFYKQSRKRFKTATSAELQVGDTARFITIKKMIATLLVPVLILVAIYSFTSWLLGVLSPSVNVGAVSFKNINNIFFEQFFNILIIADVVLLLFSFFYTDEFHKVMRNSGFIISTILIRLSFSVTGLLNTVLIIAGIVFGLFVLVIHNQFEALNAKEKS